MKKLQNIRRKILILFLSAMGLSFIVKSVFGDKGLVDIYHKRQSLTETRRQIDQIRAENDELRHEIERLGKDPVAADEIARRELGLAKKDEYVIVVRDERKPTP